MFSRTDLCGGYRDPACSWFVSKAHSYKAWIGSEEAKQTRLKSEGDQVSG